MSPLQEQKLKALTPEQINAILRLIHLMHSPTGLLEFNYVREKSALLLAEHAVLVHHDLRKWCDAMRILADPRPAGTAEDYVKVTIGLVMMPTEVRALALIHVAGYFEYNRVMQRDYNS